MNKLEEYIREQKNRFEEEPVTGHFERLQEKMSRKSRRIVSLRWSISIAASIAIIFSIGIVWQHNSKQDDRMFICENANDMKTCYLDKMNVVALQIETLTESLDPWDRQEVMNDVQNIITIVGFGLENELPEELSESKAKSILSDYYKHNLESLKMILEELKNEG